MSGKLRDQDVWVASVLNVAVLRIKPSTDEPQSGRKFSDDELRDMIVKDSGRDWKKVKANFLKDKETMAQLVAYRKRVVDGILNSLDTQTGKRLVAKSVGGDSLTSDYDITLGSTDASGIEIDMVVSFNDEIKSMFGVPPGVCFDTNLYVKDFLDVSGKIVGDDDELRRDPETMATVDELLAEERSGQDVAALIKQRQYMDADSWEEFKQGIIEQCSSDKAKQENLLQFEEAENNYMLMAAEKVRRFFDVLDKPGELLLEMTPEVQDEMSELRIAWDEAMANDDERAVQHLVDEILEFSHEHFDNVALLANNEAYMEKMSSVRDTQAEQKTKQQEFDEKQQGKLQKELDKVAQIKKELQQTTDTREKLLKLMPKPGDLPKEGEPPTEPQLKAKATAEKVAPGLADASQKIERLQKALTEAQAELRQAQKSDPELGPLFQQIDALKAEAKRQTALANFFASEAYLSEGPLQHIVNGKQAKNPEILAKLKPEHFLASINEQFGDFLKDVAHYAKDEGQAFCQTCKYLQRLLEGIVLLAGHPEFKDARFKTIQPTEADSISKDIDARLIPIRKAEGEYKEMQDPERFQKALELAKDVYGVGSIGELVTLFKSVVTDVNAVVRTTLSNTKGMRPGLEETRAASR